MAPFVLRHRLVVEEGTTPDEALQVAMNSLPTPVPTPVELA
jgi:hypothetical protein